MNNKVINAVDFIDTSRLLTAFTHISIHNESPVGLFMLHLITRWAYF